jgi:membrane protease YdiL (CAAX protease family)
MIEQIITSENIVLVSTFITLSGALAIGFFSPRIGWTLAFIAVMLGFFTKVLTSFGIIFLVLSGIVLYLDQRKNTKKSLRIFCFTLFCIFIAMSMVHVVPGINNFKILDKVVLSANSAPFSMYLNFEKPFLAFLVLSLSKILSVESSRDRHWAMAWLYGFSAILFAITVGLGSGFVQFQPKWVEVSWLWIANNLLLVCIVEELIFRRFLLGRLIEIGSVFTTYSRSFAIAVSSLLFGVAHFQGGFIFVVIATVLGVFYGITYLKAKTLMAPIATHFAINLVHFIFFTYPYAATKIAF